VKNNFYLSFLLLCLFCVSCAQKTPSHPARPATPFIWENATVYFLLTDRFNNGDPSNDLHFDRNRPTGKLRGFKGGDLKGITQKIEEGYFTDLGVNALWMTPLVEQIHGGVDEGTGFTYGFHGYWTKDWTALDPNFGTREELRQLVAAAHKRGIRILLDAVINHTGPVTEKDPVWPEDWVRTGPRCTYQDYHSTVSCTLVENLPDIKTESVQEVSLPPPLIAKWKAEGRYEAEVASLAAFFERTGYPRLPKYYIMKWLSDYISDFGIDGFRVDTVKHTEEAVWQDFRTVCENAFAAYKAAHPEQGFDDQDFYLVGEVYNYNIGNGLFYDFGDRKVNYFDRAFSSLINFECKWNAAQDSYEKQFSRYSDLLKGPLKGYGVLNYLSSHDDSQPFDKDRSQPFETATRLLLSPGTAQIYYGDEVARSLVVEGTSGDATLRSVMDWETIENDTAVQQVLSHWQKLGRFRNRHLSVGAGIHTILTQEPYVFQRSYTSDNHRDKVVIGLSLPAGLKTLSVGAVFEEGTSLVDAYSGINTVVRHGQVQLDTPYSIVLLENIP